MLFLLSLSLILRRRTVLMVFLMWFSKLVLPSLHPASVNYFVFASLLQPSLFAGTCAHSACAEEGGSLSTLQLPFSLNFSNLSLTGRFGNISILPILSLIASMAFVKNVLLVIFFPYFLTLV